MVHNVDIVSLAQNYPAGTSELFPLGANSDLRRNFTLRRNFPATERRFLFPSTLRWWCRRNRDKALVDIILGSKNVTCSWIFLNSSTSVLFPLRRLRRTSEPCKEEIRFLVSWYTLTCARNFKPLFEFQTPPARNYPAGTSELIPLAPTRIYV